MNNLKAASIMALLMATVSFAMAEEIHLQSLSQSDINNQQEISNALQIADNNMYVRDFGTFYDASIVDDNGRLVWDIVKQNDNRVKLHVRVNPETNSIIRIEPEHYIGDESTPLYMPSHRSQLDTEYLQYASGMSKSKFDMKVKYTSAQAIEIADRIPLIKEAGAVANMDLVSDHGMLMWQFNKVDSNAEPVMLVWVNAKDGLVMKVDNSLIDILEA